MAAASALFLEDHRRAMLRHRRNQSDNEASPSKDAWALTKQRPRRLGCAVDRVFSAAGVHFLKSY